MTKERSTRCTWLAHVIVLCTVVVFDFSVVEDIWNDVILLAQRSLTFIYCARYPCQSYVDLSRSSVGVVVSCIVAVFVIGVVCANDDSGGIYAAVFEL